jgi:hypothetical protein
MAVIKRMKDNKCWQGYGEEGSLVHCGGNVNSYRCYGKHYEVSSKIKKM